ncbi:hypothetical protein RvY_01914 [Ramazzottius varieornatus]|uniref:Peptidase S1 domain-containing protein n=1 Tax=Ramazzottius varieornatus TaxID=947166 RepID=A0A1D1UQ09_RAMVA|nr:hypothetical protein RvY_01914 [Ramazzottius varieornatus]
MKSENGPISVLKVIPHPDFTYSYNTDFQNLNQDFCLLKLAKVPKPMKDWEKKVLGTVVLCQQCDRILALQPLDYTDKIGPVCLAQRPDPPPKASCYATGWGRTDPNDFNAPGSQKLMEVDLRIRSDDECSAAAQYEGIPSSIHVSPDTICTLSSPRATTIRRFDPSVQYDRGDYIIDIPAHADSEPSYEVEGIMSNASWVADASCFFTPPPVTTSSTVKPGEDVTPAGTTAPVLAPSEAPNFAIHEKVTSYIIENLK